MAHEAWYRHTNWALSLMYGPFSTTLCVEAMISPTDTACWRQLDWAYATSSGDVACITELGNASR